MTLGDRRLDRRFEFIRQRVMRKPGESFPKLFADDAELEALYRFLNNDRLSLDKLLRPHLEETVARASEYETVLTLHDSTTFTFGGEAERDDIGSIDGKNAGFIGHFALALLPGEHRTVLGVLGCEPTFRTEPISNKHWRVREMSPDKRSLRWPRMIDFTASLVGGSTSLLHVMDSEGDSYELFSKLTQGNHRFVTRCAHGHRKVEGEDGFLDVAVEGGTVVACRRALLGHRTHMASRGVSRHKPRAEREAKLEVRAVSVAIAHYGRRHDLPSSVNLNVVHVYEVDAPAESDPVDWKLYTNEPIETPEQILRVVDTYRSRWVIEEFFKALKTGCAFEKRQLTNRDSILNALAVLAPVAWQLLVLRNESRTDHAPTALTTRQLIVLQTMVKKPLPEKPTARDVMLAVASLGGHIKNNGDPGWLVLGRGFTDLLMYERGWMAARGEM
jgi:hypothetical protein